MGTDFPWPRSSWLAVCLRGAGVHTRMGSAAEAPGDAAVAHLLFPSWEALCPLMRFLWLGNCTIISALPRCSLKTGCIWLSVDLPTLPGNSFKASGGKRECTYEHTLMYIHSLPCRTVPSQVLFLWKRD